MEVTARGSFIQHAAQCEDPRYISLEHCQEHCDAETSSSCKKKGDYLREIRQSDSLYSCSKENILPNSIRRSSAAQVPLRKRTYTREEASQQTNEYRDNNIQPHSLQNEEEQDDEISSALSRSLCSFSLQDAADGVRKMLRPWDRVGQNSNDVKALDRVDNSLDFGDLSLQLCGGSSETASSSFEEDEIASEQMYTWNYLCGVHNATKQLVDANDINASSNSAGDVHAKARRIRRLRSNMLPFRNCMEDEDGPDCEMDVFARGGIQPTMSCQYHKQTSQTPIENQAQMKHQVCYDSDPELNCSRERNHRSECAINDADCPTKYNLASKRAKDRNPQDFDIHNVNFVNKNIGQILHRNMKLVWHPMPSSTKSQTSPSPVCVAAWIELGSLLKNIVIHPKLMFKPIVNNTKSQHVHQQKVQLCSQDDVISVDLLDINRIMEVDSINRKMYPFAKLRTSFIVSTKSGKSFLFEASSEKEKEQFVQSLKLLVARFTSMIVVEDETVYDEFFTHDNLTVPGEAPLVIYR